MESLSMGGCRRMRKWRKEGRLRKLRVHEKSCGNSHRQGNQIYSCGEGPLGQFAPLNNAALGSPSLPNPSVRCDLFPYELVREVPEALPKQHKLLPLFLLAHQNFDKTLLLKNQHTLVAKCREMKSKTGSDVSSLLASIHSVGSSLTVLAKSTIPSCQARCTYWCR